MNQLERESDQTATDRRSEPTASLIDVPTPPQPSDEHRANLERVFAAGRRLREQSRISKPSRQSPGYQREPGYTHHWRVWTYTPAQAVAIAKDAVALANQCGIKLRRSSLNNREPQFKPHSIRFNAHPPEARTSSTHPTRNGTLTTGSHLDTDPAPPTPHPTTY